jgi:hypothetical protein
VRGGGEPFIVTLLAGMFQGIPLIGLAYPMRVAGIGVVVSLVGVREDTHLTHIWHEMQKAPLAYSPLP